MQHHYQCFKEMIILNISSFVDMSPGKTRHIALHAELCQNAETVRGIKWLARAWGAIDVAVMHVEAHGCQRSTALPHHIPICASQK
jgi:hypothetical protein